MDDLTLLRQYEPILRMNAVELFLPASVGAYVAACSLWEHRLDGTDERIVEHGALNLEVLASVSQERAGSNLYLRFVETPLTRRQFREWKRAGHIARMPNASRFAHVGISARIIDGLFRLSLLFRGRVPKGTVSAAETLYRNEVASAGSPYYGRVVREAGWTICQYWFFYCINDWRSSYHGINDHEADWETITVYLAPDAVDDLAPLWVAFSSHDGEGDALRRRADDPVLQWQANHIVAYTGAGSHSHSPYAVDELIRVEAPILRRTIAWSRKVLHVILPWAEAGGAAEGLGIPFVDYHRGDGIEIGPRGDRQWDAVLIDNDTAWVTEFNGRWGLDTGDRFGGESAPTGPRYERNGIDRVRWEDPLGWGGLQKVDPGSQGFGHQLQGRLVTVDARVDEIDVLLDAKRTAARGAMVEAQALEIDSTTVPLSRTRYTEARGINAEMMALRAERRQLDAERTSLRRALDEGVPPNGPRDHLRGRNHVPGAVAAKKSTRALRIWAAVSTSVILAILIWLLVANAYDHYWLGVGIGVLALLSIESIVRNRIVPFVLTLGVLAVGIALLVGFVFEWRLTLAALFAVAALFLLYENVRELIDR